MNSDQLAEAGRVLFGERWQTSLTKELPVSHRSMRRWLAGEMPIPVEVEEEVRQFLIRRHEKIGSLIGYLVNSLDHSVLHCPTNTLFGYDHSGNIKLIHRGVVPFHEIAATSDGTKAAVLQECEQDKLLAERFIRASAWWLTHASGRPVRAPGHADRLYLSSVHGWAVDFGANSFLAGKAIKRCAALLTQWRDAAAAGQVVLRSEVETRLKKAISGAVANYEGEEYQGYYSISDDDLLVFGAQGIGVDDGADFMIAEANLQWNGEALATPASSETLAHDLSATGATSLDAALLNPALFKKVDELPLSVRSENCLKNDEITYVGELVQKTEAEMLRTPNFGRKSLNEIKEVLVQMGLHLGMEVPGWPPSRIAEFAQSQRAFDGAQPFQIPAHRYRETLCIRRVSRDF